MGQPIEVGLKDYSTQSNTPTDEVPDPADSKVEKSNKEKQNG